MSLNSLMRKAGNIGKDYALPAIGGVIGAAPGVLTGNPALAVAGAGWGAKQGASIQGDVAQGRAKDRYEDRSDKANKAYEREQRRQVILNMLGTKAIPRQIEKPEYNAPNMTGYNTIQGLGELAFTLGSSSMADGMFGKTKAPTYGADSAKAGYEANMANSKFLTRAARY